MPIDRYVEVVPAYDTEDRHEVVLNDREFMITRSAPDGTITYVNRLLAEAVGAPVEDLVGTSAFELLDASTPKEVALDVNETTRKRGLGWDGMMKVRGRNGRWFWALTHVSPVRSGGEVVGFASVRTQATREEIDQAELMFERFRDGRARGWVVRRGKFVRTGVLGILRRGFNGSMRSSLWGIQTPVLFWLVATIAIVSNESPGYLRVVVPMAVAGSVIVAIVANELFIRKWLGPLNRATDFVHNIASGDLHTSLDGNARGEIKELFKALSLMQRSLESMVRDVPDGAAVISHASDEIASGNADLSSRTERQAASLQEMAASMDELTSTVSQNAENAAPASEMAIAAAATAKAGGDAVTNVVRTMAEISESAKRIGEIIGLIEAIAFQTNILALNAAVEAARAGEHGRGFADVASEVRSLAQRIASASKEIKALIDESVAHVNKGSGFVYGLVRSMDEIGHAVERVRRLMGEISAASSEQGRGISQVGQAVFDMDRVTQQNATLVEEAAAASGALNQQTKFLEQSIGTFRLEITEWR